MKPFATNRDLLKTPALIKISAVILATAAFFYLGKHLSDDGYKQLVFFSSSSENSIPEVSISPNSNKTFNLSSIIPPNHTDIETTQPIPSPLTVTVTEANPPPIPYTNLKPCISRIPENGSGGSVPSWPARLHTPPDRLQTITFDSYIARKELFKAESRFWNEIVGGYIRALKWRKMKLRNVLDMRAGFGGFAAALNDHKLDCWVLSVVPISGPNTLPVIYDRGLLGVMHDWCEPFDTYPRTYDFLHASGLFSVERKRCEMSTILLEMDRILRPGGRAYIRETIDVMDEIQEITKAMGWRTSLRDTSEGPHSSYRILTSVTRILNRYCGNRPSFGFGKPRYHASCVTHTREKWPPQYHQSWRGLAYDTSDDQQDITRGKGMVDSVFQAPMGTGTHNAVLSSYEYISQGLKQYNLDNMMDGLYIAPAFMDKLVVHITKNFLTLPNIKVPLILGIWGGKGQGKSFQCELVMAKMGINPIMMSAGELESGNAGEPAKLIRQRYREAADMIKKGKMCVLFINDLDAGAGRMGGTTQYTVNNQMVNATLMNIADNPTNVQLPGMYNKEENARVPIIVTGNDFSTLYAPLIRDGRMEKFYWAPTREDRIGVCKDFFGALRARVYDDEVRKFVEGLGVEKIGKRLVNSREGPPKFEQPEMTLDKLMEYGNMLVMEQENVKRVQLADQYLNEAALGDANADAIGRGTFYGKAAQQVNLPVPEGCTDPAAKNFDPTARSDDGTCVYNF
ncbi:hypothetical protein DY000_02028904 [Brassica cretica]|uniref:Ribulose bisphosphate carboxylase/oxygenase activase, chloroplastic n=1 Tax=Brassica cretica TaxID=69181 RepID=A0ABQ7DN46_BRACR|nr:hypothetical protein DY000_02028904 [Brassica cretica]